MRPCPYCGQIIKDDAERCIYCRRQVPTRAAQEQQAAAPVQSPAEQARAVRAAGARMFQIVLLVSDTAGFVVELSGTVTSTRTVAQTGVLETIEAEGWKLEHVGYVYRIISTVSRDKLFSSGQQEAVTGELVGIYLFRAVDRAAGEP